MSPRKWGSLRHAAAAAIGAAGVAFAFAPARATQESVPFDSTRWEMSRARAVRHLDRDALMGSARLEGIDFQNGAIEVDIAVTGAVSYPGVIFRVQSPQDYERIYLRPHRPARYGDGLQYTPCFNGVSGWQLYQGDGYTAGVTVPAGEWIRLRIEVLDRRARVFVGSSDAPALEIDDLKHGLSRGGVGLVAPADGSAFYSNFRIDPGADLSFEAPAPQDLRPGLITSWDLSPSFKLSAIDLETPPSRQSTPPVDWRPIESEPRGMVDISRFVARPSGEAGEPDCVFARTTLSASEERTYELSLGYSDIVSVFLNDRLLFVGENGYRRRDPSYVGAVGLFDHVFLPLREGENELVLLVAEEFGGWGFICQNGDAIYEDPHLRRMFQTEKKLRSPESVVYDPSRDLFYVSNYEFAASRTSGRRRGISKIGPDGRIIDLDWVTEIDRPAGLALVADRLYAAERSGIAEINVATGAVVQRTPIEGARLLNDLAASEDGAIYCSDSAQGKIYRLIAGAVQEWLVDPSIRQPNGLTVADGRLLVLCNGDRRLRSVDIATKEITAVADFPAGILDGIESDGRGGFFVSEVEGRIYRVSPEGSVRKILDITTQDGCADIDFVKEKGVLAIPTFAGGRLIAYRVSG